MIEKNNTVYFARFVPSCDIYEVLQLNVRTATEDWYVGVEPNTRQAYPFDDKDIGVLIFSTEKEAQKVVKDAKKKYGMRKLTKVTNEEAEE